jgi:hypothetical protein
VPLRAAAAGLFGGGGKTVVLVHRGSRVWRRRAIKRIGVPVKS